MAARKIITALVFTAFATTANAETIDLAEYFPNAQMAQTHVMAERNGNPVTTWPESLAGNFTIFTYGNMASRAQDTYIVFEDSIALVAQTYLDERNEIGTLQYLLPLPAFPRVLDLATLPFHGTTTSAGVVRMAGGRTTIEPGSTVPVSIYREGERIVLYWGDERSYEKLYIGDVPVADNPFVKVKGLARYATTWGGGIDVEYEWRPRTTR